MPKLPIVWLRSSRCESDQCVEVASGVGHVLIRGSRDPDGPVLVCTVGAWRALRAEVKTSRLDG